MLDEIEELLYDEFNLQNIKIETLEQKSEYIKFKLILYFRNYKKIISTNFKWYYNFTFDFNFSLLKNKIVEKIGESFKND